MQHKFKYVELVHFKRKKINSKYLRPCLVRYAVIIVIIRFLFVCLLYHCCVPQSSKPWTHICGESGCCERLK